jgi:hypothetical protein
VVRVVVKMVMEAVVAHLEQQGKETVAAMEQEGVVVMARVAAVALVV